jgi:TolA-binding protein
MKNIIILCIIFLFLIITQPSFTQQQPEVETGRKAKIDSLLDTYSIEDILRYREFYQKQIDELQEEKLKLREKGIRDAEKFHANNPESDVLDKVIIRLAELYYEVAEDEYLQRMQQYDQKIEDFELAGIDTVLSEPVKDFSKSLTLYQTIIDDFPHSDLVDDALYNKGFIFEETGKIESALKIYESIIQEFPESRYVAESLMRMGEYYFNPPRNDIETAIEFYKRILEYKDSPKFDEALYRLGWSYYRLNNYPEAVSYFTLLADDIERAKQIDPHQRFSNPALQDESLEYIGISFLDFGGTQHAVEYLNRIGGRIYGAEILKKIGDVYMYEKELYDDAIEAYQTLLKMYPHHEDAPEIQNKIVACFRYNKNDMMAYVSRDTLYNKYRPGSSWWQKHKDEKLREKGYHLTEQALRDNINLLFQRAEAARDQDLYLQAVNDSRKYLKTFQSDSSAPLIHWNMALTMDTKLNQKDAAYEDYMKISDLYWNSKYQKFAAENAIALTKEAVEYDTTKKAYAIASVNVQDSLRETTGVLSAFDYKRLELTDNEKKLIRAYNNYIKLFPHEPETATILANGGALYYNNNQFKEALRYFNTIVKHFPNSEDINNVRYTILESYFGKRDFKSAEIVARRLKNEPNVSPELAKKAGARLAESIFLAAEVYANSDDHLQAGNEYLRVVKEVPNAEFADLSLFNAALEYDKAREFSRAVETYNYLIETRPNSKYLLDAMNNLALDYGEMDEPNNAALTYERLAMVAKDSAQAHDALFNASFFFVKAEEWEDAIRVNKVFVQKYPDSDDADDLYYDMATYYLKLDKLDEANYIYGEYARRFPNSPRVIETYFQRGEYYRNKDQVEQAIVEYNNAVAKNEEFHNKNLENNDYYAAEALFQLTKLKYDDYNRIEFILPKAKLELEKKGKRQLLIEIVDGYTKVASFGTLRLYEATYNIGEAYEEFAMTWAKQETPPMEETRRIITQKEINETTAELYGKAEDSYKQAVKILTRLAEEYEKSLAGSDSTLTQSDFIRIVREDSTLRIARRWIDRCKEKISEIIYDIAELNFATVNAFLEAPIPEGLDNVAEMEYQRQVLGKAITPLIQEIIEAHTRNVRESWKLGLENQWVKLSRQKILTSNNVLASEYNNLAQKSLALYETSLEKYVRTIEGKASEGIDAVTLSDQMANLIDFGNAFAKVTMDVYKRTLEKANEENISDPIVSETKEKMLKDLYLIAQTTQSLTEIANSKRKKYEKLFTETDKIEYEEALFTFEDNYFSLKEGCQELLELGYQISQQREISNQWVPQIMLALVQINPDQYCSLLNLKVKTEQIVSDETWKATDEYIESWVDPNFNISLWDQAHYIDKNTSLYQGSLIPIWFSGVDTIGFVNDTTQVDTSKLKLVTTTDSLGRAIILSDSIHGNSSKIQYPNQLIMNKKPQISKVPSERVYFRKKFLIDGLPVTADIKLIIDDSYNLFLNGKYIATFTSNDSNWQKEYTHQLTDNLVEGENVIAIEGIDNDATGGGLIAILTIKSLPGWEDKKQQIQLETSDIKIKQNLIMDKYIIMH